MYNNNTHISNSKTTSENIDIPYNNNRQQQQHDIYYGDDLLAYNEEGDFTSSNMMMMQPHQQQISLLGGDDPMTDHNFLAFLSLLSSSEPTPFLFQQEQQNNIIIPEATTSANILSSDSSNNKKKKQQQQIRQKRSSLPTSNTRSTKIGQCEHPKHVIYRQEKYTLSSSTPDEISILKTIPRKGRPPKGSKSTEFLFSTSPASSSTENNFYSIAELTVRPLPKRLEAVVGKSNIKVCLTCLKRSDTDQEYIQSKLYIGPQQIYKKKKSNNNATA